MGMRLFVTSTVILWCQDKDAKPKEKDAQALEDPKKDEEKAKAKAEQELKSNMVRLWEGLGWEMNKIHNSIYTSQQVSYNLNKEECHTDICQ